MRRAELVDEVRRWLRYAREDLEAAEVLLAHADSMARHAIHRVTAFERVGWPNGADFDPAMLYDWPRYGPELEKMAKSWSVSVR